MTPIEWALTPLKKYADFTGRAPRAEYWWFVLMVTVASMVASIIDSIVDAIASHGPLSELGIFSLLLTVATFIPSVAAQVRRLHDTNRTGWWVVAPVLPILMALWVIWDMLIALGGLDPDAPDSEAASQIVSQSASSLGPALILSMVAVIVSLIILVFLVTEGDKGDNRYGPDPYAK